MIERYIRRKEDDGEQARSVSAERVRELHQLFVAQLGDFARALASQTDFYGTGEDTREEAHLRVGFLKDVIENKGGHTAFYVQGKPITTESQLHIFYRLTWFATISDVSREVNDGRGPADFKISRGASDKTIVEFKLARNSQLKKNLEKQAEIYKRASDASNALKVIIYFTLQELKKVQRTLKDLGLDGNRDIVLIDARRDNKPSASKA